MTLGRREAALFLQIRPAPFTSRSSQARREGAFGVKLPRGRENGRRSQDHTAGVRRQCVNEAELMFRDESDPVPFGKTFVQSDAFRTLFREGMGLVEETAAY